jgi:hypothetical protein
VKDEVHVISTGAARLYRGVAERFLYLLPSTKKALDPGEINRNGMFQ